MELETDCARATEVCSHIKDGAVRFFWLKLGESLAVTGKIPRLVRDDPANEDGGHQATGKT